MAVSLHAIAALSPRARRALQSEASRQLDLRRLEMYRPYPKQAEFHAAPERERALIAASRVGKTLSAAAETAMHLSGMYPEWWVGRRFDRAVTWMAASETGKLTRDGIQAHLVGWPVRARGAGMIPVDCLMDTPAAQGTADSYDYLRVRHVNGGESICYLRSYDQGRERVQAMTLDGVWLDEEPDEDYYIECLTRTNTTLGPMYLTTTPLRGMSEVVERFIGGHPGTRLIGMTIDDAEHYTPAQRAAIIAQYKDHELDARVRGIPNMGSGRVFPSALEDQITVSPIPIPAHWPRIVGMDIGYDHPTAASWLAWDRDSDIVYVTDCYRVSQQTPIIHAAAIAARGKWIPVAWPHDALQHDKGGSCEQIAEQYRNLGLKMLKERATFEDGTSGVEAGLIDMHQRMQTGRFKVFSHLAEWFEEFRMYHRKKGLVVKERDDLISATRYAVMSLRHAKIQAPQAARLPPTIPLMDPEFGY